MTEREYLDPSPRDRARILCEEQLLFVVGRELFGKLQDILRACLCALICLPIQNSASARNEFLLTRNYATW